MIASFVPARMRHAQSDTPGARASGAARATSLSGLARSVILPAAPTTSLLISDPPPWVPRSTVTIVTPVRPLRHPPAPCGVDRRPKGVGVMGEHTARQTSDPPVRVLIVEDHEVLSSSLAMVLDGEPDLQTVARAPTLAEARRAIVATEPDVVLLDHQLPDGDGVASIEELRALHDGIAFVVLTASNSDAVLVAAVQA